MSDTEMSVAWLAMDTAPRDGTPILLTDGLRSVHLAWFKGEGEAYPWFLVDDFNYNTGDCGVDSIELNSAMEAWPAYWSPLPAPPVAATLARAGDA